MSQIKGVTKAPILECNFFLCCNRVASQYGTGSVDRCCRTGLVTRALKGIDLPTLIIDSDLLKGMTATGMAKCTITLISIAAASKGERDCTGNGPRLQKSTGVAALYPTEGECHRPLTCAAGSDHPCRIGAFLIDQWRFRLR